MTKSILPVSVLFLLSHCKGPIEKGEALAIKHCQSCHMLPEPSLLDAKSWDEGVLPNMGPMMGIFRHQYQQYPSGKNDRNLDSNFYPKQPLLSPVEWQQIIDYYTATSPGSMPAQQREKPIAGGLNLFWVQKPQQSIFPPATCFVKITDQGLVFADYGAGSVYRLNSQLLVEDSVHVGGPVVDIDFQKDKMIVCDIGQMNPNNGKFGKLKNVSIDANGKWKKDSSVLLSELARPVKIMVSDLDGDSVQDYIVCEFGFMTGGLTWNKKVLRPLPGSLQMYQRDHKLWVLFSQGEEGVFVFTNKGKGQFEQQQVLRLPPSYGSTFFELVDFDKDGDEDIVYTCGDNADYSPVLKPYHGVYIFLNDGADHFTKDFFFPINGCYKALARDYDNDGDMDIAAISFFADYEKQPQESFVYLDNRQGKFFPLSFPEAISGRWLTMDAGDVDKDGKTDLVLGNFSKAPAMLRSKTDWSQGPAFIVLKNTGRRNN